ncbi:metal-dependent transcriptional regulator [bacterium]|nr:metal-dependent transcriptional regulator [bacterium]
MVPEGAGLELGYAAHGDQGGGRGGRHRHHRTHDEGRARYHSRRTITLTPAGERLAEAAIRRHRLAERLLTEVLAMDEENLEQNACSFEHTLSPEVTDSICTLLGHPPTCPHGLPIPRGACCKKAKDELKPIVQQLNVLEVGDTGRIIFIASNSHVRLDKLGSLGIVPGSTIRVHQKRPAFVIQLGETTLALDPEIIKEIYVRKLE